MPRYRKELVELGDLGERMATVLFPKHLRFASPEDNLRCINVYLDDRPVDVRMDQKLAFTRRLWDPLKQQPSGDPNGTWRPTPVSEYRLHLSKDREDNYIGVLYHLPSLRAEVAKSNLKPRFNNAGTSYGFVIPQYIWLPQSQHTIFTHHDCRIYRWQSKRPKKFFDYREGVWCV